MSSYNAYINNPAWKWIKHTPEFKDMWIPKTMFGPYGMVFLHRRTPLKVVITVPKDERDSPSVFNGELWVHVSVSREDHLLPNYGEMSQVKRMFIGDDKTAYSVWAKSSDHINIKSNVLHLWHRIGDQDPLPNFGAEGTI